MYFFSPSLSVCLSPLSPLSQFLDKQTLLGHDCDGTVLICEANWSTTNLNLLEYSIWICRAVTSHPSSVHQSVHPEVMCSVKCMLRAEGTKEVFWRKRQLDFRITREVGGRECHMLFPKLKKCIRFSILSLFCWQQGENLSTIMYLTPFCNSY